MNRRVLLAAPLVVAGAAGAGFLTALQRMEQGRLNPHEVPSPVVGHRVPAFRLPGLSDADLAAGHPLLVNFFASWCVPCVEEVPVLLDLRHAGVPVIGIAYKDQPEATARFLAERGNPYTQVAPDQSGLVAIDWGVSGVPETFLIDPAGVVRWHYALPLTTEIVAQDVTPMLHRFA